MVWWLLGCVADPVPSPADSDPTSGQNVVVIVLDDVGIDKIASYGVGPAPPTPTFDALAAQGVRFQNAWTYPTCSPGRAALFTGRHPRRYGIGDWIDPYADPARLPDEEVTLPELVATADPPWDSSLVGKWHLTTFLGEVDQAADAPGDQGFGWHEGTLGNIDNVLGPDRPDDDPGYYLWQEDRNGDLSLHTTYATTETTDDAIARMEGMAEPWLLVVAYNAAHSPLAPPPIELVPGLSQGEATLFDAVVMATDREMGRLVDAVPQHTSLPTAIVVWSDNGTPVNEVDASLAGRGGKGSPYELGVRTPLVVVSPDVVEPGRTSDALVHVVDLFPTLAEWAGVKPSANDGLSLAPYLRDPAAPAQRSMVFSEAFWPNGPGPYDVNKVAVRTDTRKYVSNRGTEEFYRIGPDGLEGEALPLDGALAPEDAAALAEMKAFAASNTSRPFEY